MGLFGYTVKRKILHEVLLKQNRGLRPSMNYAGDKRVAWLNEEGWHVSESLG